MSNTTRTEFPPVTSSDWKQKIVEELKGKPFEDLIWHTKEGFDIQPFYTAEDQIKTTVPPKQQSGWTIRHDLVVKEVKKANAEALAALTGGAESIAFNVSKVDITKSNLNALLKGIDTKKIPVHFSGVKIQSLEKLVSVFTPKTAGSVQFADFSNEELPFIIKYAAKFRSAGFIVIASKADTAAAQLIKLLEQGIAILHYCNTLNIPLKKVLPTIRFSVSLSSDYFMEIAKLRALRLLWTQKVNEFEPVKDVPVFIHAENLLQKTEERNEHYNLLRATTIAMAAVVGGCDSLTLHASAFPGKPKAFNERIFRNIQLLLKHESYFEQMTDTAEGSYYLETLTQNLCAQIQ